VGGLRFANPPYGLKIHALFGWFSGASHSANQSCITFCAGGERGFSEKKQVYFPHSILGRVSNTISWEKRFQFFDGGVGNSAYSRV
jgi:hypothetical protein